MARATRKQAEEIEMQSEDEHLQNMSIPELNMLIDKVVAIKNAKVLAERQGAIERAKAILEEYELTPEDLIVRRSVKGERKAAVAKYRGPGPDDVWSGRGKPPRWLSAAEAEGRNRSEFLIDKA